MPISLNNIAKAQDIDYLVSPYTARQRVTLYTLITLWFISLTSFFVWWFDPAHVVTWGKFWVITLAILWITLLPAYFIFFVLRARIPNPEIKLPDGWRVAMVVTKVPSEPLPLVQRTIEAMMRQKYPHDTWLADEDPAPETIDWCQRHRVRISSRKNCPEYHRKDWPRRTRCKEGNLAYFYDHFGYHAYDFVVQMDADHVPQDDYLEEMLRPFVDQKVGYVSAPSICDLNADRSWPARARLYAEAPLHGITQTGHTNGFAPLCFGSHYAVRSKALLEIGGLGPELAEDHSTSLMMNAAGWRGVHAIRAIARGYGPQTFADLAIQEFQWARSLVTILLEHTPRYWNRLPLKLKIQFAFSQFWYLLFSLSMLVFLFIPPFALFYGVAWVNVIYLSFLWQFFFVIALLLLINRYLVKLGLVRPLYAKILSWEAVLFIFVRWPWSLLGCAAAVKDRITGSIAEFKITPKSGASADSRVPLWFSLPYLVLSIFSISPVFLVQETGSVSGYVIFSAINSLIYGWAYAIIALTRPAEPAVLDSSELHAGNQH